MKIIITSREPVLTSLGRLPAGVPLDLPELLCRHLIEHGDAVLMEVKEAMDRPILAAGKTEQSFASPVAQALPQTTLPPSESGAKRRGRPRKAA